MVLPNFLIIGAAKAGTTSLCYYLNQHPEVYISPDKEPRFFTPEFYTTYDSGPLRDNARRTVMSIAEYEQLFAGVTTEKAIGEATTEYIYFPGTAERIYEKLPDVKLISILRDPAERAFSAFCYQLRDGCETGTFEQALQDEAKRHQQNWRPGWLYTEGGYYHRQLQPYFAMFPRSQIRIYLYEELDQNPQAVLQDIFEFLAVDTTFSPELSRQNVSKMPKSQFINNLIKRKNPIKHLATTLLSPDVQKALAQRIKRYNLSAKPELAKATRQQLVNLYREDILKLEQLIGRNLAPWLEP